MVSVTLKLMPIALTCSTAVHSTWCTVNKSHDLFTHQAVVIVRGVRKFIHPEVFACKSKLGIAIKTARVFIDDSILLFCL